MSRADWPAPFLKHQEQCPLEVPGTDYPEYIKANPDRTRTHQAYMGMLERMVVGSQGRDQDFTAQFMKRISTPMKKLSNSVNNSSQTRTGSILNMKDSQHPQIVKESRVQSPMRFWTMR